ncbi:hypothetical protein LPB72_17160 [Hydrogenophaga crassostreae]|uniref:DUF306 domain-containing protein n=1 Tax=Hydrogenophaga crassostreae TaxID=1763535 RepID=A0A162VW35_9BURK|nr:hypothetical protein LPB072_07675 [Hydrogenophaga crassostreae]OAD40669.1 hypothetical protein LPB72_17160 [Hydrogenophaga crassostreae]
MLTAADQTQAQSAGLGRVRTLETPGFTVHIEVTCAEGEVTCDRVFYRAESRRTKQVLTLRGSTRHSLCADGITPCRFLGYTFENGAVTCFVSDAGELLVREGTQVLVEESGEWQ